MEVVQAELGPLRLFRLFGGYRGPQRFVAIARCLQMTEKKINLRQLLTKVSVKFLFRAPAKAFQ